MFTNSFSKIDSTVVHKDEMVFHAVYNFGFGVMSQIISLRKKYQLYHHVFIYLLNTIQYAGLFKCGREQQRSHVPRGRGAEEEEEEEAVKVEVYNQGMFKTELCNKWQEKGTCPYGDLCQFAHGITELRPIIRHPRYKTEVCRMVLAGATCPYGHRCHFRHSLCPPWLTLPWCQKLEGWVSWNVNNSKQ